MSYYRLYFMCARSGHIMKFAEYEAPDDQSAIALALEHEGEQALELWCGRRKVTRIEAADAESEIIARWQLAREEHRRANGSNA